VLCEVKYFYRVPSHLFELQSPNDLCFARFEVYPVMKIQVKVLWPVMPCNFVVRYQCTEKPAASIFRVK
jgi:hypothetical protein